MVLTLQAHHVLLTLFSCCFVVAFLTRYKNQLRSIYAYYSSNTWDSASPFRSEILLEMGVKQWMDLCEEAGIMDRNHQGCQVRDLYVS